VDFSFGECRADIEDASLAVHADTDRHQHREVSDAAPVSPPVLGPLVGASLEEGRPLELHGFVDQGLDCRAGPFESVLSQDFQGHGDHRRIGFVVGRLVPRGVRR